MLRWHSAPPSPAAQDIDRRGRVKGALPNLNPARLLIEFVAFLFALTVHEAAHAWTAWRRGDETARLLGRVTLNPIPHIDLFGTLIFPIVTMLYSPFFFGWAKPTPVDTSRLKNRKWDDILVTLAGPASNLALALLAVGLLHVCARIAPGPTLSALADPMVQHASDSLWVPVTNLLFFSMIINVVLAIFNVLPIPPLDGSHVLVHFLPGEAGRMYRALAQNGMVSLLLLVAVVYLGILNWLFEPALGAFQQLLPFAR
jgi:Zn-dependent protease